jgi:hypothetical protein
MIKSNKMKKISFSVLLTIFLLTSTFVRFAYAADAKGTTWYTQSFGEWSAKVFDRGSESEIFGERYTFAQVQWIVYSLAAMLISTDILECIQPLITQTAEIDKLKDDFNSCLDAMEPPSAGEPTSYRINGPITGLAYLGDMISPTYLASGTQYLASSASKLHIIPEAKAQGIGFTTLSPIQKIWKAVRNITYLLLIIVVVVMAFMIMFRVKISPQTVISIQSALPKIIVALILITFSYAIAGLIIDLSYLVVGIVAMLAKNGGIAAVLDPPISTTTLFSRFLYSNILFAIFLTITVYLLIVFLGILVVGGIAAIFSGGLFAPIVVGGGIIAGILLLLAGALLLIIAIRIFWLKLKTFINVLLLIIAGPIMILLGAVSPASGGFGSWLKSLIANVAVFPVIIIMIFLSHYFFWGFYGSTDAVVALIKEGSWLNPFEIGPGAVQPGSISLPGFGGDPSIIGLFVSFGLLFLVPHTANLIKSLIEGQPFAYGSAIGEGVSSIFTTPVKLISTVSEVGKAWTSRLGTRRPPPGP